MPQPKKPYKRFQPILAAKMAADLKQGKQRAKIAGEIADRFGIPQRTAITYLSRLFPQKELRGLSTEGFRKKVEELLWRYREGIKSRVERSEIARRREAKKSPEERREIGRKRWDTAKARGIGMAGKSAEERSEIGRKAWAGKTPEERSEIGRRRWVNKTPEERREIGRKRWAGKTPKERSEIGRRAWEKRLSNVSYVKDLPRLDLVGDKEKLSLLDRYMERFRKETAVSEKGKLKALPLKYFRRRPDFEDIKMQYQLGILDALGKWDRNVDLDRLVTDSLIYHLIEYFSGERKYHRLLSGMDVESGEMANIRRKFGRTLRKRK